MLHTYSENYGLAIGTDLKVFLAYVPSLDVLAQIARGGEGTFTVLANVRTGTRVSALVEIQVVLVASFVRTLIARVISNVLVDIHVID